MYYYVKPTLQKTEAFCSGIVLSAFPAKHLHAAQARHLFPIVFLLVAVSRQAWVYSALAVVFSWRPPHAGYRRP